MATKNDWDFDTWMDTVKALVLDGCGVEFRDEDSVRGDYEDGKSAFDVADDIIAEYEA